jgi:glycosyltransferase involved in cell wall biosynthesis
MTGGKPNGGRIRVLVLIKGLGMGGAEQLILESAKVWDRDQFEYEVAYVLPWKDQLVEQIQAAGIRVHCIGGAKGRMGPGTVRRFSALTKRFDPHLVHAHLPTTGVLARLVGGRPVIYTEHNLADSYRFPTGWVNRVTYGRNRAVGAVSEAVADSLKRFPGPEPLVIPNGVAVDVSPDQARAARQELKIADSTPLIVHVGNIRPLKGHENLIAAAKLIEQLPDFLIASVGGEKNPGDLDRVNASAAAAGMADHIRFLGRRDDARSFIAAADLFVNPSDVEGLPLVVLEALALARPVVATSVGGVPSVVIDGETGRLVPPGDPEALAAAITDVLLDPNRGALGDAGAALVTQRFGAAGMVATYEKLYLEATRG